MNRKRSNKWTALSAIIAISGILLLLNLGAAIAIPGYVDSVVDGSVSKLSSLFADKDYSGTQTAVPSASQGGINIQKTKDNMKAAKDTVESRGSTAGAADPAKESAGESSEQKTESDAAKKEPAASTKKAADGKKDKAALDPEMLRQALDHFQDSFRERNVILDLQENQEKPYISKSFRNNPFDDIEAAGEMPDIGGGIPPPPYYAPANESRVNLEDKFKKYVEGVKLKGVVIIDDRFIAFIDAGRVTHMKAPGETYQDQIKVNVDDVSADGAIISDEYGSKGILEFEFRSNYIVQPVDDAIYITNLGI